jgi:predicted ArsR family transcriptional regulator
MSREHRPNEARRAQIITAMKTNGPMTIASLAAQLNWGKESIRTELLGGSGVLFEEVVGIGRGARAGSTPRLFYLTAEALGVTDEEYDRLSDQLFQDDGEWFPKADALVVRTIDAMVRAGRNVLTNSPMEAA